MARHDQAVKLIVSRGRQLGRSLALLAHYVALFAAFAGRFVQWMANAGSWTTHLTRCTLSAFDGVYTHLRRALRWKTGVD